MYHNIFWHVEPGHAYLARGPRFPLYLEVVERNRKEVKESEVEHCLLFGFARKKHGQLRELKLPLIGLKKIREKSSFNLTKEMTERRKKKEKKVTWNSIFD